MYTLEILSGERKDERFFIREPRIILGREDGCRIQLTSTAVSREHAVLEDHHGQVRARDLDAVNPLEVNGTPVQEALLEGGDVLTVGDFELRFDLVIPPLPIMRRVTSPLLSMTRGLVAVMLLAQLVFIITVSVRWRKDHAKAVGPDAGTPTELVQVPSVEPPPVEPPPDVDIPPAPPLVDARPPAPLPEPVPAPPVPSGPPLGELLAEASQLMEKGDLITADLKLRALLERDPQYLEAYAERARLYERRSMFAEAVTQWRKVVKLSEKESTWERMARKEIYRLIRLRKLMEGPIEVSPPGDNTRVEIPEFPPPRPPEPEAVPDPVPSVVPAPSPARNVLRIQNARMDRYSESDNFEEMRMLTFTLQQPAGAALLRSEQVRIQVTFYDRERGGPKVGRSQVRVTPPILNRDLSPGDAEVLTTPYIVPKGMRFKVQRETGRDMGYYGYHIEVFRADERIASEAWPEALKEKL